MQSCNWSRANVYYVIGVNEVTKQIKVSIKVFQA